MRTQAALWLCATGLAAMSTLATAVPTVQSTQAFTEFVGPNPYFAAGWRLGLGATNIDPAGPGTTVDAIHLAGDTTQDMRGIAATPSPVFPRAYISYLPYTGQSGQWRIDATDASGTGSATTHRLDDVRQLPLVQGLAASGDLLAPTIRWDQLDPVQFPGGCVAPCQIGFDFFNYGVVVRSTDGTLLYQSTPIANRSPLVTQWTLPGGLMVPDQTYVIGLRLNMSELEAINPNGMFFSPLENRSSSYLVYSTVPVPELASAWLLAAGLAALAGLRVCRRG